MNDILNKILSDKTPEEFVAEVAIVRKKIGSDNKYDISAKKVVDTLFDGGHYNTDIQNNRGE